MLNHHGLHRGVIFVVLLGLVMGFPLLAVADDPPKQGYRFDAPTYAIRGPYFAGTHDFIIGEGTDRPLSATIWYPALNPDGVEETVTYDVGLADVAPGLNMWYGRAIRDAAPDLSGGPYPLVIFSPGDGGSRFYGSYMIDHLVSHGFVVIGADHTGNTLADNFGNPDATLANKYATVIYRPLDVTTQIDTAEALTAEGEFKGLIDLENIAVMGASFGGYTALAAAGGQLDMRAFAAWCEPRPDNPDCPVILSNFEAMATLAGLDAVPDALWPALGDPRVDAALPIVPGFVPLIGPEGLKAITIPTMVILGTHDTIAGTQPLDAYEGLTAPKTKVAFESADHFLMGGFCPESWEAFPIYCWDAVWDMDRMHDLMDHFVLAFMLATLKGDADAMAALAPDAVQFAGITYETTEFGAQ